MAHDLYLLSHQDDEIAILKSLKNTIQSGNSIHIYFLTNGNPSDYENSDLIKRRENESLKVLYDLGIKPENIEFIGRKLNINSYKLINNLDEVYEILFDKINKLQMNEMTIYTHAWEGGNLDHDSSFVISLKLLRKVAKIKSGYQFPFYNSYKIPIYFFRVFHPIDQNGSHENINLSFTEKLQFIKYLFEYSSQLKIWIGLYPFIIFKILINEYNILQKIKKNFSLKKPHENMLWYEKQKFAKFDQVIEKYNIFLNEN